MDTAKPSRIHQLPPIDTSQLKCRSVPSSPVPGGQRDSLPSPLHRRDRARSRDRAKTANELSVADLREMTMFTPPPPRLLDHIDNQLEQDNEPKGPFPSIKIQKCDDEDLSGGLSNVHLAPVCLPDGLSKSRSFGSLSNTTPLSPIGSPSALKTGQENKEAFSTDKNETQISKSRSDGSLSDSTVNSSRNSELDVVFPPFEGLPTPRPPLAKRGTRGRNSPRKPARLVPIEFNKSQP